MGSRTLSARLASLYSLPYPFFGTHSSATAALDAGAGTAPTTYETSIPEGHASTSVTTARSDTAVAPETVAKKHPRNDVPVAIISVILSYFNFYANPYCRPEMLSRAWYKGFKEAKLWLRIQSEDSVRLLVVPALTNVWSFYVDISWEFEAKKIAIGLRRISTVCEFTWCFGRVVVPPIDELVLFLRGSSKLKTVRFQRHHSIPTLEGLSHLIGSLMPYTRPGVTCNGGDVVTCQSDRCQGRKSFRFVCPCSDRKRHMAPEKALGWCISPGKRRPLSVCEAHTKKLATAATQPVVPFCMICIMRPYFEPCHRCGESYEVGCPDSSFRDPEALTSEKTCIACRRPGETYFSPDLFLLD